MATSEIQTKPDSYAAMTITLASLTNGSGRQSTLLTNSSKRPAALVSVKVTSGGVAPTAGSTIDVYLIRSDGTVADDGAGASDAAITIENAEPLGSIVLTATTAKTFRKVFDTTALGPLGPSWGIALVNRSGQTVSTTAGDHSVGYTYLVPEAQ